MAFLVILSFYLAFFVILFIYFFYLNRRWASIKLHSIKTTVAKYFSTRSLFMRNDTKSANSYISLHIRSRFISDHRNKAPRFSLWTKDFNTVRPITLIIGILRVFVTKVWIKIMSKVNVRQVRSTSTLVWAIPFFSLTNVKFKITTKFNSLFTYK